MLPDVGISIGKSVRRLNIPNTFDIEYMYAGQKSKFTQNIRVCS